jgi:hypothetical protein
VRENEMRKERETSNVSVAMGRVKIIPAISEIDDDRPVLREEEEEHRQRERKTSCGIKIISAFERSSARLSEECNKLGDGNNDDEGGNKCD